MFGSPLQHFYALLRVYASKILPPAHQAGSEFEGAMFSGIGPASFGGDRLDFPVYFANGEVLWIRLSLEEGGIRLRRLGGLDQGSIVPLSRPEKAMKMLFSKIVMGGRSQRNVASRYSGGHRSKGLR